MFLKKLLPIIFIMGLTSVAVVHRLFQPKSNKYSKQMTIAMLQSTSHPALNAARQGFIQELQEKLGTSINIIDQNAEGSLTTAHTIAQQLHTNNSVVGICTIGTLATQAMAHIEKKKPIFMIAVSDPASLGVIHQGTNVCGPSDAPDVKEMVRGLLLLVPHIKKIALLHNPAEPNSVAVIDQLKKEIEKKGLFWILAGISNEAELLPVLNVGLQNADAMLVPPINIAACAIATISKIAWNLKKPIVLADEFLLRPGILAVAGGVNYHSSGKHAAKYAIKVLTQNIRPDQLPVKIVADPTIHVHKETLKHLGLTIPRNINTPIKQR